MIKDEEVNRIALEEYPDEPEDSWYINAGEFQRDAYIAGMKKAIELMQEYREAAEKWWKHEQDEYDRRDRDADRRARL